MRFSRLWTSAERLRVRADRCGTGRIPDLRIIANAYFEATLTWKRALAFSWKGKPLIDQIWRDESRIGL